MSVSRTVLAVILGALLAATTVLGAWAQSGSDRWYEGAAGYKQAFAEHKRTGKPLLLYFYAPWCGYCRKLDNMLVGRQVKDALRPYVKVRVYPEESSGGEWLSRKLGNRGYPDLHIWGAEDCHEKVSPFRYDSRNDDWVMETPTGFIGNLAKACD